MRFTSLAQIPASLIRLGLAANADPSFRTSIDFDSYTEALRFREAFYATRKFLSKCAPSNLTDEQQRARNGLNTLSLSRLTRLDFEQRLDPSTGMSPLSIFTTAQRFQSQAFESLDAKLSHIKLSATTLRNIPKAPSLAPSPQEPTPTPPLQSADVTLSYPSLNLTLIASPSTELIDLQTRLDALIAEPTAAAASIRLKRILPLLSSLPSLQTLSAPPSIRSILPHIPGQETAETFFTSAIASLQKPQ